MSLGSEGQDTKKRPVGIYVVGFIVIVGTILGVAISYFSSIVPSKQKALASLPRGDAPNPTQSDSPLVSTNSWQKEQPPSSSSASSGSVSSEEPPKQTQPSPSSVEHLPLQEQVKKLKEMLKERDMSIAELNEKISKMGASTMRDGLKRVPKMVSIAIGECVEYGVGRWDMPKECAANIINSAKEALKKEPSILVWEVVPRVDTIAYKGLSPELKQHGLGAFRADSIKRVVHLELGSGTIIFQSGILQEPNKRGFLLKAYKLEY